MTHSITEGEQPFMSQLFYESVQASVASQGHCRTAELLKMMGIPFGKAYELIFNRLPREWGALELLRLKQKTPLGNI